MKRSLRLMAVTAAMAAMVSTAAFSATTRYEAEASGNTLIGCMVRDGSWASGGKFVGDLGENTIDTLKFNGVLASAAGDYIMTLGYDLGGRPLDLVVNDGSALRLQTPSGNVLTKTISLNAGANTISILSTGTTWASDIDYIDITPAAVPEPSSLLALAGLLAPAGLFLRTKRA